jgi:hypothetical protein
MWFDEEWFEQTFIGFDLALELLVLLGAKARLIRVGYDVI